MRRLFKKLLLNIFGEKSYAKVQFYYWLRKIKSANYQEPALKMAQRLFRPGDVILDIGAHFGRYTVPLAHTVGPQGKIFSFEPVESAFKMLSRIVDALKLKNVEVFNCAMGDGETAMQMVIPLKDGVEVQSRAALDSGNRTDADLAGCHIQEVDCETIDAFVERKQLAKLNFLKCDVEGAEYMVMKGGQKTLRTLAPVVLLEIEARHTEAFDYTPTEIAEFMKSLDYGMYVVNDGKLAEADSTSPDYNNYFFIPKGWQSPTNDIFRQS